MLQSAKLKKVEDLKNILSSAIEMHSLVFSQLVFSLDFVQYFLTVLLSLCFQMLLYILCHDMLEVYDLLFNFEFIGDYS